VHCRGEGQYAEKSLDIFDSSELKLTASQFTLSGIADYYIENCTFLIGLSQKGSLTLEEEQNKLKLHLCNLDSMLKSISLNSISISTSESSFSQTHTEAPEI
jgi:hypothetical protein